MTNEPHPRSLISAFVVHSLYLLSLKFQDSSQSRSVAEQVSLSLTRSQARGMAQMLYIESSKTNKMTCVPSEDSDQPVHLPCMISFAVCMKKFESVTTHKAQSETLIRVGRCRG